MSSQFLRIDFENAFCRAVGRLMCCAHPYAA